jgi:hypothetical protein
MIKKVLLLFPFSLLLFIRQLYVNLLGINRDMLTGMLVVTLVFFALLAFSARMRRVRPDFLALDFTNLLQLDLAGIAVAAYFVAGRIAPNQAVFAAYYNCFAPFLIYSGFLLRRMSLVTRLAALIALAGTYAVTLGIAVCQSLGVNYWLFEYDRYVLQKNYLGITRASGLYGTQIDYGLLGFLVFTVAFYLNTQRRHWFSFTIMVAAAFGILLSMARIWVAAMAVLVLFGIVQIRSIRTRLKAAVIVLIGVSALYYVGDQLGVVGMLRAVDEYTQDSNEGHWLLYEKAPEWLSQYLLIGTGPGTQNGPDVHDQKVIGDFLFLGTAVEFGGVVGAVLVLSRVATLLIVLRRCNEPQPDNPLRKITIAVCIAFLSAAFVDSAFAHLVSIAVFYVICGLYLYERAPETAPLTASVRTRDVPEMQMGEAKGETAVLELSSAVI